MSSAATPVFRSGTTGARLATSRALAAISAGLVGITVVAVVVLKIVEPVRGPPPCPPDQPCAGPPPAPPSLATGATWRSSELRFRLRYLATFWKIESEDALGVVLSHRKVDLVVAVQGEPSIDAAQAVADRFHELRTRIPELTPDGAKAHRLYGPSVGYRDGAGRAFRAATSAGTLSVLVMAATHRGMTAVVTAATGQRDVDSDGNRLKDSALNLADSVLNTFRWPGE